MEFNDDESLSSDKNNKSQTGREFRKGGSEWKQLYRSLREKLGDTDVYRLVCDPTTDTEVIQGSLADDLADIYGDLKEGLTLLDQAPEHSIWHWRFDYSSHWGRHAQNALRTIHCVLEASDLREQ